MIKSLKKHAWKPVAFCFIAYSAVATNDFINDNADITSALTNNNGDIDSACKSHLTAIRLTQSGYYASTDSMNITKTPPEINIDMNECREIAAIIKQSITPQ